MLTNNESPDDSGFEPSNDALEAAVCRELRDTGHHGLRGVAVRVDQDRVTLTGTVTSYFLKQVAQETVRRTCPHHRVYNELQVARLT